MYEWLSFDTLVSVLDVLWHWRFWACMAPAGALAYISFLIFGLTPIGWTFIIGLLIIGLIAGCAWDWSHSSEEPWFFTR
jgi:hypothetical protein